jgi:TPR repeat protein
MGKKPGFRERCAHWLLLLTMVHTVPVVWITPVAGGTAPTVTLLAFGLASLLTFTREGAALGLIALAPALAYCGIAWVLSWVLGKGLARLPQPARASVLAIIVIALLLVVYFPVYVAGGHNSSRNVDLIDLFDNTLSVSVLVSYWIALHGFLALLYAGYLLRESHPAVAFVERWRNPVLITAAMALTGTVLYGYHPQLVCRPLAELGSASAQLCAAKKLDRDQHYWYERAAEQGELKAIAWLIEHTRDHESKLRWLRKGAEQGDPVVQFALYQRLLRLRSPDALAEAERWLRQAAEGDHAPAQMVLIDQLSKEIYRTQSRDRLAERNAWLERAAERGSRMAKLRLAQHHIDGSMGYPADLDRARAYMHDLADGAEPTSYERARNLDAAYYQQRLEELSAWSEGLENGDPVVTKAMAERYLGSQIPGAGVPELGRKLLEEVAAGGDKDARDELIVRLRTDSGGLDKDTGAAMTWLISAAESGDTKAMERLAGNYMSGREGFAVDYPKARRWIEALIRSAESSDDLKAQARVRNLKNQLAYIDRLGEHAGEPLLGESDLNQLGQRSDAESHYRYAQQLLAGHGSKRRAEAVGRLEEAARLGHGGAAWRFFHIYDRGFSDEIDKAAALRMLQLAGANHHFDASRELAMSYEYGKSGLPVDLPRAIALYEETLAAGRDNRYEWNLDPDNYNHYRWLESRLRQARMKLSAASRPPA